MTKYPNNRPVADFFCARCQEIYELKSKKGKFGRKVADGAYRTKCERLASDSAPNLILLNYGISNSGGRVVTGLIVVPKQFFIKGIIEERRPLSSTAQRAGWVGSNILLNEIPDSGRIHYLRDGEEISKDLVLAKWQQTLFLRDKSAEARGWLIEVMNCVEKIGQPDFYLSDVYDFEPYLSALYPNNRNVKQKIRQQLQFLRNQGFLEFLGHGHYRLRENL